MDGTVRTHTTQLKQL